MNPKTENGTTYRATNSQARRTGGTDSDAMGESTLGKKRPGRADALARELHAIGNRCAKTLKPGPTAVEHDALLYDEQGLPR